MLFSQTKEILPVMTSEIENPLSKLFWTKEHTEVENLWNAKEATFFRQKRKKALQS